VVLLPVYMSKHYPIKCGSNREIQLLEHAMKVAERVLDIGVNFCKAPRLEPPNFLKSKAFQLLCPSLFVRCNFLPTMKLSSTV